MDRLVEKRGMKPNTLNSYVIIIRKILKELKGTESFENLDFLEDIDAVGKFVGKFALATQKNYLNGIIVSLDAMNEDGKYTDLIAKYREIFEETRDQYNKDYQSGVKSKKQESNWTDMKTMKRVMNRIYTDLTDRGVFKKSKDEITKKEFFLLQKWVIANLFIGGGRDNPPTRADYAPMEIIKYSDYNKLEEEERKDNNYLVIRSRNTKYFQFNEYKTAGTFGEKIVKLGSKLNSVMNIWLKYNDSDSVLLNSQMKPMSANGLVKMVPKVFESTGKNITINLIRHIFISEEFPNQTDEKSQVADKMMHSVEMQGKYSLKD